MENLIATNESQRQIATDKLTRYIDTARERSGRAMQRIMTEVPSDKLVRASAFEFVAGKQRVGFRAPGLDPVALETRLDFERLAGDALKVAA